MAELLSHTILPGVLQPAGGGKRAEPLHGGRYCLDRPRVHTLRLS